MPLENQSKPPLSLKIQLISFIKKLWPQWVLLVLLDGMFGVLLFLSRTSMSLYWYGVQLSVFFFLILAGVQWIRFKKNLQDIEKRAFVSRDTYEPSGNLTEQLHQNQYLNLEKEFQQYKQKESEKNKEQMDYFSLWLHQIKTPISAISLLLQKNKDLSGQKQMEQELLRLNDYTHMALNYLKLEDSGKDLDLEWISLDEVIKETVKKYSILFIYNGLQLDYEPVNKKVLTDRKWLQVLIEQILSNSLKYTKTGKIRIYVQKANTLVIEDTGAGIRQEDLPKIFEKGYTGLNGRLHEKSTGLGLFLSKKICQRLGHRLQIESELGRGTKVYLDLKQPDFDVFD
ncbi:sensor histidine kinase [Marinilactibacillus piezotolerans]|uniref:sensor histidine kinase n=1 Tax=Marinilactibacillus piezotolerans TaxID=258723 RepID=UPI002118FE65|nr:sensor histidine kinase [Marinilactibacillus piezotolerans]